MGSGPKVDRLEPFSIVIKLGPRHVSIPNFITLSQKLRPVHWTQNTRTDIRGAHEQKKVPDFEVRSATFNDKIFWSQIFWGLTWHFNSVLLLCFYFAHFPKLCTGLVLLTFKKIFDFVWHNGLDMAMIFLGFPLLRVILLESFLWKICMLLFLRASFGTMISFARAGSRSNFNIKFSFPTSQNLIIITLLYMPIISVMKPNFDFNFNGVFKK